MSTDPDPHHERRPGRGSPQHGRASLAGVPDHQRCEATRADGSRCSLRGKDVVGGWQVCWRHGRAGLSVLADATGGWLVYQIDAHAIIAGGFASSAAAWMFLDQRTRELATEVAVDARKGEPAPTVRLDPATGTCSVLDADGVVLADGFATDADAWAWADARSEGDLARDHARRVRNTVRRWRR